MKKGDVENEAKPLTAVEMQRGVICDPAKVYTSDELYLSPEEFNRRCKPIVDNAMKELANAVVACWNEENND